MELLINKNTMMMEVRSGPTLLCDERMTVELMLEWKKGEAILETNRVLSMIAEQLEQLNQNVQWLARGLGKS